MGCKCNIDARMDAKKAELELEHSNTVHLHYSGAY